MISSFDAFQSKQFSENNTKEFYRKKFQQNRKGDSLRIYERVLSQYSQYSYIKNTINL